MASHAMCNMEDGSNSDGGNRDGGYRDGGNRDGDSSGGSNSDADKVVIKYKEGKKQQEFSCLLKAPTA